MPGCVLRAVPSPPAFSCSAGAGVCRCCAARDAPLLHLLLSPAPSPELACSNDAPLRLHLLALSPGHAPELACSTGAPLKLHPPPLWASPAQASWQSALLRLHLTVLALLPSHAGQHAGAPIKIRARGRRLLRLSFIYCPTIRPRKSMPSPPARPREIVVTRYKLR